MCLQELENKGKARLVELDEIGGEVEDLDEPMLEEGGIIGSWKLCLEKTLA